MLNKSKKRLSTEGDTYKNFLGVSVKRIYALGYYFLSSLHARANIMHTFYNSFETLQLLHLLYTSTSYYRLKPGFFPSLMSYLSDTVSFYPFLQHASATLRRVILYFTCSIILLNALFIVAGIIKNRTQDAFRALAFYVSDYSARALFIPMAGTLMLNLRCEQRGNQWFTYLDPNEKCISAERATEIAISSISLLLFILIISVFKISIIDHKISPSNPFAQLNGIFNFSFHICRCFLLFLFILIPDLGKSWIYTIAFCAGAVWILIVSHKESFLYNEYSSWLRKFYQFLVLAAGVHYAIIQEWNEQLTYGEYGGLFVIGLAMFLVYTETLEGKLKGLSLKGAKKYKSREQIHYYIDLARVIEKSKADTAQKGRLFWLYASYHHEKCKLVSCPLSQLSGMLEFWKDSKERKIATLKQAIALHFKQAASLSSSSVDLKLLYIAFVSRYLKSYVGAWFMVDDLHRKECNLVQGFHVYVFKKKLKKKVKNEKNAKKIAVTQMNTLLESERESRFKQCVENTIQSYACFWAILQERNPQFNTFMRAGFDILECQAVLEKLWEGFKGRKSIPLNSLRLYATLCENVLEDSYKGAEIREFLHEAKDSIHEDSLLTYAKNGSGVITVNGEGENLGKIYKYNAAFAQLSGYGLQDLVKMPLDYIIPSIYKEAHQNCFAKYYKLSEANSEALGGGDKHVFMLNKARYLVPIVLKITESPNYTNNYTYVACITLDKELASFSKLHLLLNTEHEIVATSSNCVPYLELNPDSINMKSIKISEVVPSIYMHPESKPFEVFLFNMTFQCLWSKVTSNGTTLGYYVQLSTLSENLQVEPPDMPFINYQFLYHPGHNGFYIDTSGENPANYTYDSFAHPGADYDQPRKFSSGPQSSLTGKAMEIGKDPKDLGKGFYMQILERIEKVCLGNHSHPLYQKCIQATDYSKEINTYRIEKDGNFKLVKSDDIPMLRQEELYTEIVGDEKRKRKQVLTQGNTRIIKNAMRSKRHLYRTIVDMPLPNIFNGLIYVSLAVMMISFAIAIAEKFILDGVLSKLYLSIDSTHTQFGLISAAVEMSSWMLQATAVQRYWLLSLTLLHVEGYNL